MMKLLLAPFAKGNLEHAEGLQKGPEAIVKQLEKLSLNEQGRLPVFDFVHVNIDQNNITQSHQHIFDAVKEAKENFILLGGDHSVTHPAVKAFTTQHKAGMVIFDAHPDLMHEFTPPTYENYLRTIIEDCLISKDNIILVGLHRWDKEELSYIRKLGIKHFSMKEITREGLSHVMDGVMEVARQWPALYLSIDIDAVDPAYTPGTGHAEPGGLTARELLYALQRMKMLKNLKGIDLVEVNPDLDKRGMTVALAAKIVAELA